LHRLLLHPRFALASPPGIYFTNEPPLLLFQGPAPLKSSRTSTSTSFHGLAAGQTLTAQSPRSRNSPGSRSAAAGAPNSTTATPSPSCNRSGRRFGGRSKELESTRTSTLKRGGRCVRETVGIGESYSMAKRPARRSSVCCCMHGPACDPADCLVHLDQKGATAL
jgi:hypothetical protein